MLNYQRVICLKLLARSVTSKISSAVLNFPIYYNHSRLLFKVLFVNNKFSSVPTCFLESLSAEQTHGSSAETSDKVGAETLPLKVATLGWPVYVFSFQKRLLWF